MIYVRVIKINLPVRNAAQSIEVALVVISKVTRRKIMVGGVLQKPVCAAAYHISRETCRIRRYQNDSTFYALPSIADNLRCLTQIFDQSHIDARTFAFGAHFAIAAARF
jgi:hypothetical protein